MGPTPGQRSAAEQLKSEGNVLFSKGKYGPAAERYTEAITLDPTFVTLYVNRGMCYKKMKGRWDQVAHDAQTALSLSRDNLKAHYLLGIAQRELHNLDVAITHLGKALDAAREQGDSIKDEIWRELAKAEFERWQIDSHQRIDAAAALRQHLDCMLEAVRLATGAMAGAATAALPSLMQQAQPQQQQQQLEQQWQQLFQRAAHLDTKQEVPSAYTCPLTMEVMRDPVITPSGVSYERSALMEHLSKVGRFDPISRTALGEADIIQNVGLRNAIQQYLTEHPWAWAECL